MSNDKEKGKKAVVKKVNPPSDKTAWALAQDLGIVPVWTDYFNPENDKTAYRDKFRNALIAMQKAFHKHLRNYKTPIDPGPRPEDHDRPELPSDNATQEECKAFAEKQDKWLDEVYWPAEAERLIWEAANGKVIEHEYDLKAASLSRRMWLAKWSPIVFKGLLSAALVAAAAIGILRYTT